jgi:prepilin-type N-terminal cleavage/methylation domain-containing protein
VRFARRNSPGAGGRRRGFTLLEILLVLILLALLGSVMIGGAASLLNSVKEQDPEAALLVLLQKVRKEAVETGRMIELEQLPEDKGFIWGSAGVETLPLVQGGPRARLLKPEFGRASLIGGQLQEETVERLRFYPDGSCDPVRLEVRRGDARRVFSIDPWTAAPLPAEGPAS